MEFVESILGTSEFGFLSNSPLTLSEIRDRQDWSEPASFEESAGVVLQYGYLTQTGYYPTDIDHENKTERVDVGRRLRRPWRVR